jgi:error-prone DNA polymerase
MPGYIELHCHSNFSLLDGAAHPEELVARAAGLGMPALALTDHDAVYGAPRFIRAARQYGLRPILGAELTLTGGFHLTVLVENEAGWHNLCYLISRARHDQAKGSALLPAEELVGCTTGLIALSGCRQGEIAAALLAGDRSRALNVARHYRDLFGPDNFYIELQRHFRPGDERLVPRLTALAAYLQLDIVATNNVHYPAPDRHRLQDVLVAIRHRPGEGTTLDTATHLRRPNSEYYLKSATQMADLFPDHPQALTNTLLLAERCHFELEYGLQDLPHLPTPHGMSSSAYLHRLCEEALPIRYRPKKQSPGLQKAHQQMVHELEIIDRAGLANYFLIVWDIVRFSRQEGIRCQGRGSAANSLVAYLLHISPIDPLAHDLVFERFLSDERQAVPDIDIDFDAQRREEVIQYIYQSYGADHTAMACTFVTFRARSAIRDIGKALGLAPKTVAAMAEKLREQAEPRPEQPPTTEDETPAPTDHLLQLARQIESFPRHLGIHSGGMIITGPPLMGRVPTEPATMPDRVVVQWDKDGLEDAGLVKIDILGLGILAAITEAVDWIEELSGVRPDLDDLSFDDPAVFEMISQADTIGVFQVESRAQAQMLPRLKPNCFADLVVAISLIRPGPIQGNMVHPYLRRREGLEQVTYAHPALEPALAETLGVILFQEQVLKVARDLAGFSPGQGEQLRRALGSKRAGEAIERFFTEFISGAQANGVPAEVAQQVFDQLRAFGGYSFAKSHAAAFAVVVYQSAWLKHTHFCPFYAALLNNQPMGFWTPAVLINEIRRRKIPLHPLDLHQSREKCVPLPQAGGGGIRLGLNYVKGLREEHISRIITERAISPYESLADFYSRIRPGRRVTENLINAGAMDSWGLPRRQLLWELGALNIPDEDTLDLQFSEEEVELPALTPAEAMLGEQDVMGLSTGDHIMAFFRPWLKKQQILDSERLTLCPDGQLVHVAGLVVVHQAPPTAKGHHFITLEDENGMINVIIRPRVHDRYRRIWHDSRLLIVQGQVQQAGGSTSLLAQKVAPLQSSTPPKP